MQVTIRKFNALDIPNKVKWINDPRNNRFLHYDLPLEENKTALWFEKVKDCAERYDAVIEVDGIACGLIGLLNIDRKNSKAEYYVSMGEAEYQGKGVATEASKLLLAYAFEELGLNRIYLYTETENVPAQHLFEKVGFTKDGRINHDLYFRGRFVDRYLYSLQKSEFQKRRVIKNLMHTPVQDLGEIEKNRVFVKREDLIPYSFGGNKARKALLFFREINKAGADCVVTYGSYSSNHCRVVANLAAAQKLKCYIISPEEALDQTYNSRMMTLFGAQITACPVERVSDTIAEKLRQLKEQGSRPYFIPGGGHGNIGTQAYVDCYEEIVSYERENGGTFDYIVHASGTGTTQAGLVCGQIMHHDVRSVVGISIARKNPRGADVVRQSVREYLDAEKIPCSEEQIVQAVRFIDEYISGGYGKFDEKILQTIRFVMTEYGIPLDTTYTGKAFAGMLEYLRKEQITGKRILFIHTGGTPLFFDDLGGEL